MAFQGEYFVARYGARAAEQTPPAARMLEMGVPVGGGTDATRVASYNPWTALSWLVTGQTVGGLTLYPGAQRLSREAALQLWTAGSAWFSSEQGQKGQIKKGQLADLAVLSADYLRVPEDEIAGLESVLTVVGGRIVHAAAEFKGLDPPALPVLPSWSPVASVPGHYRRLKSVSTDCLCASACGMHGHAHAATLAREVPARDAGGFWGALGCSCFAF